MHIYHLDTDHRTNFLSSNSIALGLFFSNADTNETGHQFCVRGRTVVCFDGASFSTIARDENIFTSPMGCFDLHDNAIG